MSSKYLIFIILFSFYLPSFAACIGDSIKSFVIHTSEPQSPLKKTDETEQESQTSKENEIPMQLFPQNKKENEDKKNKVQNRINSLCSIGSQMEENNSWEKDNNEIIQNGAENIENMQNKEKSIEKNLYSLELDRELYVNNNKKKTQYCLASSCCLMGSGFIGLLIYFLTRNSGNGGGDNACQCFSKKEMARIAEELAKNGFRENVDFSFCPKDNEDFYVFNISRWPNTAETIQYYNSLLYSDGSIDFENDFDGLVCKIGVKDPQKFFKNEVVRKWLGRNVWGIECIQPGKIKQNDLSELFKNYTALYYVDISNINLSSVEKMEDMFYGCSNLTNILANWQSVNRCTDMSGLFYNCSSLKDLSLFIKTVNVTNVEKMDYLFSGCSNLENIDCGGWWKLKSIISISHLFDNCGNVKNITLPQVGTNLQDISYMFADCKNLEMISSFDTFHTSNVKNMNGVFYGCKSLTFLDLPAFYGKTESMEEMFAYCDNLTNINIPLLDTENLKKYENCFVGDYNLKKVCCSENDKISMQLSILWNNNKPVYINGCYNNYLEQCSTSELKTELKNRFSSLGLIENIDYFWSDLSNEEGIIVSKLNNSCFLSVKKLHVGTQSIFLSIKNLEHIVFVKDNAKNISTFYQLFKDCKNLKSVDFENINTSNVINMSEMFDGCVSLQNVLNLKNLNLSKTTTLSRMFRNCISLEILEGTSNWDTAQVTDISSMFENCTGLRYIPFLEKLNVANVKNMNKLFYNCSNIQSVEPIQKWNARSLTNIGFLFYNCSALSEITLNWFTNGITDMSSLFDGCSSLISITIDGLSINPACVYGDVFNGCGKIEKVCTPEFSIIKNSLQDLWTQAVIYKDSCYQRRSDFICPYSEAKEELNNKMKNLGLIENSDYYWCDKTGDSEFFVVNINNEDCYLSSKKLFVDGKSIFNSLVKLLALKIIQDCKNKIVTAEAMFENCRNLISVNLEGLDFQNAISVKNMFRNCNSLTSLDLGAFNTKKVESFESMFEGCEKISSISFNKVITNQSKSFKNMFKGCKDLTSVDLSLFDTKLAEDMSGMFDMCEKLIKIDLRYFSTPNLKNMSSMFKDCYSLTEILWNRNFDTSNVTNMVYLFYNCKSLSYLTLNFFNTSRVENLGAMFVNCASLKTLDVSFFDTSNAVNMSFMFYGCSGLTSLTITNFQVNKVTTMAYMFAGCGLLSDLNLWHNSKTESLIDMQYIFFGCVSLKKIDLAYFVTSNVKNMDYAFGSCVNLKSLNLINFDSTSLTTANYMFSDCWTLQELYANDNFSPGTYVSTANIFYNAYSIMKVCMKLNPNMLSSLQEAIGQVSQSGECYFKIINSWWENEINAYKQLPLQNQKENTLYIFNNNSSGHLLANLTLK